MLRTSAVVIILFAVSGIVRAEDKIVWLEYPESGVVLGQGYDLLEGKPSAGTCVDFVPIQDPSQSVEYRFEEVTSMTEVRSKTSISASGSMKMAILTATARLSFLSDEEFKLETQKFLLTASVVNSALFAAPALDFKKAGGVAGVKGDLDESSTNLKKYEQTFEISMKNPGADLLDVERCGQGFVAAIVSGATLDAFLTMSKTSANSLADIKGGLEADIANVFSVSGSFEQQQTSNSVQQNTSVSAYKSGGSGGNLAFDLATLKASMAALPTEAAATPKPIRIAVLPYKYLSKVPGQDSYTALVFTEAVAAYFLDRDVFQATKSVIESYGHYTDVQALGQPFFLAPLEDYVALNARAMRAANRLSQMLALCQSEISEKSKRLADSTSAVVADLQSSLGVSPRDEGRPRGPIEFPLASGYEAAQKTRFDGAVNSLTGRSRELGSASASPPACSTTDDNSFFREAVGEAVELSAKELSLRPVYWSDLGPKFRESLGKVAARIGDGTVIPDTQIKEIGDRLTPFVDAYRSGKLVRDVCDLTFSHPLCNVDFGEFVVAARPRYDQDTVHLTQLQLEFQNSGQP